MPISRIIIRSITVGRAIIFIILIVLYLFWGPFSIHYDDSKYLGGGYIYHEEHSVITGGTSIGPKILQYTYNSNFIIASEDYRGESYMPIIDGLNQVPFDTIDIDKDNIIFWIVNKKTNQKIICGSENELINKCNSLGISEKLISKFISKSLQENTDL